MSCACGALGPLGAFLIPIGAPPAEVGAAVPVDVVGPIKTFSIDGINDGDVYFIEASNEDPATPVPSEFTPIGQFTQNDVVLQNIAGVHSFVRLRRRSGQTTPTCVMAAQESCACIAP